MKKKWLLAVLLALAVALLFSGCVEAGVSQKTYEVTFMSEGEVYETALVPLGSEVQFPETAPQKQADESYSYVFKGWSRSAEENAELITKHIVTGAVTFYAVFQAEPKTEDTYFTVTFVDGLTEEVIDEQSVKEGEAAKEPAKPEHAGYTFDGWNGDFTVITKKTIITANYKINSYKLTTSVLGNNRTVSVTYNKELSLSAPESAEGYEAFVFDGWFWDENFESPVEASSRMPACDVTVYAKYSVDFSEAALAFSSDHFVYGGENVVTVESLVTAQGLEYSCCWNGEIHDDALTLTDAGEYDISVEITAVYNDGVLTDITSLQGSVTVEKAELSAQVLLDENSIVYGSVPAPSVMFEGFVNGDEVYSGVPAFIYMQGEEPAEGGRLSAGIYTVTATFGADRNYTVAEVQGSRLTVTPKNLTVTVSAANFAYGEIPQPSWEADETGFVFGDTPKDLQGTAQFAYTKNSEAYESDIFVAGEYQVTATGLLSQNYTVVYEAGTFTVSKKEVTLTISTSSDAYVYGDEISLCYNYAGMVEGDSESVFGTPEPVYTKDGKEYTAERFSVGEYFVTVNSFETENYTVAVQGDIFNIAARSVIIGKTQKLKVGESWVMDVASAEGLLEGDVISGTISLNTAEKGAYNAQTQEEFAQYFAWDTPCAIQNAAGEDIIENYEISYNLHITLDEGFIFNVPDGESKVYDGEFVTEFITVQDAPEGFVMEYKLEGDKDYISSRYFYLVDAGTYTICYRISAPGYFTEEGIFTYTIDKANGSVNVSAVKTDFTYNGKEQTVVIDGVATYVGDGKLSYTKNTFTTVKEGNSLTIVVTLAEGKNYTGASAEIKIRVSKATYSGIGHDIVETTMSLGQTLEDLAEQLGAGFEWKTPNTEISVGQNGYDAVYNADPENYEDFALTIEVNAVREEITLQLESMGADYQEAQNAQLPENPTDKLTVLGEDGEPLTEEERAVLNIALKLETTPDFTVGSTYAITYSVQAESDYFDLTVEEVSTFYQVKTVEVNGTLYTIEDALSAAAKALTDGETLLIIVRYNTSFADINALKGYGFTELYGSFGDKDASFYTVPAGATLLLPFDENASADMEEANMISSGAQYVDREKGPYVELSVPQSVSLKVQGNLYVNAATGMGGGGAVPCGYVNGDDYSALYIESAGEVAVQAGGLIHVLGYAYGEGKIVVNEGATVKELFSMPGWKGGSISAGVAGGLLHILMQNPVVVFPLNQYNLNNIICKLQLEYGAKYVVQGKVFASNSNHVAEVDFVSDESSSFLQMTAKCTLEKSVDEKTGNVLFDVYGDAIINNLTLNMIYKFSTAGTQVPIPGNFVITVHSGTATIPNNVQIKLLPGADLIVEKGATLSLQGKLFAYGSCGITYNDAEVTQWKDGGRPYPYSTMKQMYRVEPVLDYTAATPATVLIKGTMIVEAAATLAAEVTGENGAVMDIRTDILSGTIKEDKNTSNTTGKYFESTIISKATIDGVAASDLAIGSYKYNSESGWQTVTA